MHTKYTIAAFYKFVELDDLVDLRLKIKQISQKEKIKGTIILAKEGINGTVSGSSNAILGLITFLHSKQGLKDLAVKYSYSNVLPFEKLKVVIKKEIVTFGISGLFPHKKTGVSIESKDWNNLITRQDVLVIDTRNSFEVECGTFKGAINPGTKKFSDFPAFVKNNLDTNKHKNIAMFCTGGIRCEKASAFLLEQGFENVYQLKGGILKYLRRQPLKITSGKENVSFLIND